MLLLYNWILQGHLSCFVLSHDNTQEYRLLPENHCLVSVPVNYLSCILNLALQTSSAMVGGSNSMAQQNGLAFKQELTLAILKCEEVGVHSSRTLVEKPALEESF